MSLMIALDVNSDEKALSLVNALKSHVPVFKVGMQLFYQYGPELISRLAAESPQSQWFLDLKLHDIPNTVSSALKSLASLPVSFVTVHASGGPAMLQAAQKAVSGTDIKLLGVTVLTSLDEENLLQIIPGDKTVSPKDWALQLTQLCVDAGLHGIVCSPLEVADIRTRFGNKLTCVTPGIRLKDDAAGDQSRLATPDFALEAGASWLVIGRPVTQSSDPVETVKSIKEICQYATGLPA